jgi:hypothetical protein
LAGAVVGIINFVTWLKEHIPKVSRRRNEEHRQGKKDPRKQEARYKNTNFSVLLGINFYLNLG